MELDLGLLKDETYGLYARYVWEASRFSLWVYLNKKLRLHEQAHTIPEHIRQMSLSTLIGFIGRFLYSIITYLISFVELTLFIISYRYESLVFATLILHISIVELPYRVKPTWRNTVFLGLKT